MDVRHLEKKKKVIRMTLEKKEASQKHLIYSGVNLCKWVIFTELYVWGFNSNITAEGSRPDPQTCILPILRTLYFGAVSTL